jgi:hypothetical protein
MQPMKRLILVVLAAAGCVAPLKLAKDDSPVVLSKQLLTAPDPSQRGSHAVRTLYYGSGTDKNRPVFKDSVTIKTASVDGSKLADVPGRPGRIARSTGASGSTRCPSTGASGIRMAPARSPRADRARQPQHEGLLGSGYGYLGELLASRGFIMASVDENFLNGGISRENDARGWMLLQHLKQWRRFNDSTGSPLQGKVDMNRIALMGHSRGGEAIAVAASFNRLTNYPDDATIKFDFNFNIKSLVAIAPRGRSSTVRPTSRLRSPTSTTS